MNVVGLDVGGANIKVAFIESEQTPPLTIRTVNVFFPLWIKGKKNLKHAVQDAVLKIVKNRKVDVVGVTMTAEVSDVYFTKEEGVNHVLDCVQRIFSSTPIFVLDVEGNLLPVEEARRKPYKVASANWMATGWLVSRFTVNSMVVDVGSTTTDVIPIVNHQVVVRGKTDLERLAYDELIYTGILRTNLSTITNIVPIGKKFVRVSSEFFASTGDVHLVLGNLKKEEYTTETADGRGKSKREAMARIARIVCADLKMLDEKKIKKISRFIYVRQIKQVAEALKNVYNRTHKTPKKELSIVVTGIGKKILAEKAAKEAGFRNIVDIEKLTKLKISENTPAAALTLMVLNRLERGKNLWMQS
ncbi:H4MPT-linked C1 transfer pathway protein [Candidatus Bathyarchaeota archaeon]|nr:MAG: H4MPT-linked C1 transfer pathway protein [Candidatus Bathyarchaeota archaeon]